jgi:deoxyribodipyrimidine photolyase-related protein
MPVSKKGNETAFIVYPNVLFSNTYKLDRLDHIFLVEEPLFFGGTKAVQGRQFNLNKIKLAYMRATMKAYHKFLEERGFRVSYVDYDDVGRYGFLSPYSHVRTYEIIDFELIEKLRTLRLLDRLSFQATLLFPLTLTDVVSYFHDRDQPRYTHSHFYKWAKAKLGILEDVKSYDIENRNSLPKNHELQHHTPRFEDETSLGLVEEASGYIDKHPAFKHNVGNYKNLSLYPLDHKSARSQFLDFVNNRLNRFGQFQDAVDKDEPILYHSFCSTAMNNGLLPSDWVVKVVMEHRKHVPMSSLEAYVRQLCWRMWEVGIYLCFHEELRSSNHFGNTRKLKWDMWRGDKKLDMFILDNEIEKAVNLGYAAHIPRLMIFLNMFVMLQVRPEDVVRWFMEIVSMDATIYFMWSIVVTMGGYNLRFMQKPYISTSAYLLKLSNYPKGEWCDTFTAMFYDFLHRNKSKLTGSCSIYLRNLAYFERQSRGEQNRIRKLADNFRKRVTSMK